LSWGGLETELVCYVASETALEQAMEAWIREAEKYYYDDPLHFCSDALCGNYSQARHRYLSDSIISLSLFSLSYRCIIV